MGTFYPQGFKANPGLQLANTFGVIDPSFFFICLANASFGIFEETFKPTPTTAAADAAFRPFDL